MALVQRASPKRLTNLFRFPKRSLRSLRFPGESNDCSSSPALAYGIHVFHCPVSHPCFGFWLSCLFMVLEFKMGVLEWMCRMQLGLWPSYPSPLLPEEVTYSVPMCLCRKTSTSSIPEGTLLLKNWGFICNFINGVCYVWWKEVFCGESRHFFVCLLKMWCWAEIVNVCNLAVSLFLILLNGQDHKWMRISVSYHKFTPLIDLWSECRIKTPNIRLVSLPQSRCALHVFLYFCVLTLYWFAPSRLQCRAY